MSLDTLNIRKFEMEDRILVEQFFNQMGGETRAFFNRARWNEKDALGFFEGKDRNVVRWMALDGETMVGYVFVWGLDKKVPWLGIAVAEDYKGKRLGQKLLQTAYEYALAEGKGGILLTTHVANLRAQALYERCGYERLGMHASGEILYILRFDS